MSTLTYESDGLAVQVRADRNVGTADHERWSYEWTITDASTGDVIASATDLETPGYDLPGALRSVMSFLGAWCEAQDYPNSDNRDLFPASILDRVDASTLGEWAGYASLELEPAI